MCFVRADCIQNHPFDNLKKYSEITILSLQIHISFDCCKHFLGYFKRMPALFLKKLRLESGRKLILSQNY